MRCCALTGPVSEAPSAGSRAENARQRVSSVQSELGCTGHDQYRLGSALLIPSCKHREQIKLVADDCAEAFCGLADLHCLAFSLSPSPTHTHTHAHTYYRETQHPACYITAKIHRLRGSLQCVCVCLCVFVCVSVCLSVCL